MKLKIRYLNGSRLYYAFLAGGNAVIHDQAYLNRINVFPVPDGDTGTNLASTFRAIAEGAEVKHSIRDTLKSIANAALYGAQGNSGLILAQFLYGLSKEVGHEWMLTTKAFGESVRQAAQHAAKAILHPVEGTMITVIHDWAEAVYQRRLHTADFEELFSDCLPAAHESLRDTPKKLAVLAKAGVVDAGAKGFVDFLEGILQFIQKGRILRVEKTRLEWAPEEIKTPSRDKALHNRYCSEALLTGADLDGDAIRAIVERYGDSAVVAGSDERIRIHVHTNAPADLFFELKDQGAITQIKVDDMKKQYEAAWAPKSRVAIVTDSACDLPQALMDERQIHFVPMNITWGRQLFLDKLTLKADRFYDLLETEKEHPKSSVPALKVFQNALSYLAGHYDSVVAITLAQGLSGTHGAFHKAAESLPGKTISVINSNSISAGEGLLVARASELALAGRPHEEIVRLVESWVTKTRIFVDVLTLKYFIRGGRVSAVKGFLARMLAVKPILVIDEHGQATHAGKSFNRKGNMIKILSRVKRLATHDRVWGYALVHAKNPERVKAYEAKLTELLGRPPAYVMDVSPVIGVHSGVGAVAVAVMME
ncbi:MAG: DegV family EDD domain-containing protein [Candidatus Aminicenantes bacterium]|nr:DegV family EDD domain-containing protein [Candidatus Aminicenantes bacterium]